MTTEPSQLELEAIKRKERLKNLKRKRAEGTNPDDQNNEELVPLPKPVFRNYKPEDDEIKGNVLETPEPGDVEAEILTQLELMKTPIVVDDIDISTLAPRKPDWDLKRDVAKKFEKLERRTQKAIAELIRDRLKAGQENILQAVNVGAAIEQKRVVSNDVDEE